MKRISTGILMTLLTAGIMLLGPSRGMAQVSVSFQVFYDNLSPYGTWVNNPTYGYVWIPNAGPGFVPYETGGHWVYTEYGWTWVSDYDWGWAPFHYGRWYIDPVYGAMWVPGTEWGPAWVTWRHADGYWGWAPMAPGIGVDVYLSGGYNIPADHWCFVHERDFGQPNVVNHVVSRSQNNTIINHTTVVNNTVVNHSTNDRYAAGPPPNEVQRATGRTVNTVAVHDAPRAGKTTASGNSVEVYRPRVDHKVSGQKPAPNHVAEMKDVKPVQQRSAGQPAARPISHPKAPDRQPNPVNGKSTPASRSRELNKGDIKPVEHPTHTLTAPRSEPAQRQMPPARSAPQPHTQQPEMREPMRHQPPQRTEPMRQAPMPHQAEPIRRAPMPHQAEPIRQVPTPQPHMEQPRQAAPPRMEQPHSMPQSQPMRREPMHQAPIPMHNTPARGPR
ncbi:MAG: hypothetical protein JST83_09885 [Bacteroidetes bacterium]|nr:hypothetical protein [Bacteroidota bacterium]